MENSQVCGGLSQHWIFIKAKIEALVALNLPNDVLSVDFFDLFCNYIISLSLVLMENCVFVYGQLSGLAPMGKKREKKCFGVY